MIFIDRTKVRALFLVSQEENATKHEQFAPTTKTWLVEEASLKDHEQNIQPSIPPSTGHVSFEFVAG